MHKLLKATLLFSVLGFFSCTLFGQIPPRPNPARLVNDFANVLSLNERDQLERKLVDIDNTTSVQICIVTTYSLGDYDITQFADELGEKWGVGTKGKDNGVVIVVKPKEGKSLGEARISVGYGLEGVIPDATAGQIVDNEMISRFKNDQYYAGLDSATSTIAKFASGEYNASNYKKKTKKNGSFMALFAIIIIGIVVLLMKVSSSKNSNISSKGDNNGILWLLLMMFMSSGGGRGGGGFGGGSSGGGFGGFGGGSFGGGGASGSW